MNRFLLRTTICLTVGMLMLALPQVVGAFPSRGGGCAGCHNDGSGDLDVSPDPFTIMAGSNGLITFDVTSLPASDGSNMIAVEDISIAALAASIGAGGNTWTRNAASPNAAFKSVNGIGLGQYVLNLVIGQNAVLGDYQLNWRLAGGGGNAGEVGTSGLFTVRIIPEPAALVLFGLGVTGLVATLARSRRRRRD